MSFSRDQVLQGDTRNIPVSKAHLSTQVFRESIFSASAKPVGLETCIREASYTTRHVQMRATPSDLAPEKCPLHLTPSKQYAFL